MEAKGRRIGARSRARTGNLATDENGDTLHVDIDPSDPGAEVVGDTGDGISIGIDIGFLF